jgi:hypothetical protein
MMTGVWANCQLKALIEIVAPFTCAKPRRTITCGPIVGIA